MLDRDSGLTLATRNSMGTSGDFFFLSNLPAQGRISPSLTSDPKNLESSCCEGVPGIIMRQDEGLWRESQSSTTSTPRFTRNHDTWNRMHHNGGTYSQNCMIEAPRYTISRNCISEKSQNPDDFQCWRVKFKTEVCVWVHRSLSSQCCGSMKWRWQDQ